MVFVGINPSYTSNFSNPQNPKHEFMYNPFSLENKVIIVTGASSGIGAQCAIDCSKMGAKVVLVARNEERLQQTLNQMEGDGHLVKSYNLNDLDGIKSLVASITSEIGKIDGFIHAAGIEITKPIKLLTPEDYETVYRTNALAGFEFVRQLSSIKNTNNGASVVLISSISGVIGRGTVAAYAASKGAMISATRTMSVELAKRNIRVNCVSPGTILTPMMQNVLDNMDEETRAKRVDGFLLGLGETTDISNACIYLLSDAAKWVTGQNLIIDGGYTAR